MARLMPKSYMVMALEKSVWIYMLSLEVRRTYGNPGCNTDWSYVCQECGQTKGCERHRIQHVFTEVTSLVMWTFILKTDTRLVGSSSSDIVSHPRMPESSIIYEIEMRKPQMTRPLR
jgi:hypothetical protein